MKLKRFVAEFRYDGGKSVTTGNILYGRSGASYFAIYIVPAHGRLKCAVATGDDPHLQDVRAAAMSRNDDGYKPLTNVNPRLMSEVEIPDRLVRNILRVDLNIDKARYGTNAYRQAQEKLDAKGGELFSLLPSLAGQSQP